MKTKQEVLKKITEMYDKAIVANDTDLAARLLELATRIVLEK